MKGLRAAPEYVAFKQEQARAEAALWAEQDRAALICQPILDAAADILTPAQLSPQPD